MSYLLLMLTVVLFIFRRPRDWSLSWGGGGNIYGWGHNHRGQLGGLDGSRLKTPQICENLSSLQPVQICGGEQSLFLLTADGKVCFLLDNHYRRNFVLEWYREIITI